MNYLKKEKHKIYSSIFTAIINNLILTLNNHYYNGHLIIIIWNDNIGVNFL